MSVLALMAVAAQSCTPRPEDEAQSKAPAEESGPIGRTPLGAFLAARMAQNLGDNRSAAEYYETALKFDPDNVDLLQRTFTLMVAEGRINDAFPLAERLLAFDSDAPLPSLVLGLRDARGGQFANAETRFATLPKRGVFSFLSPLMTAWARAGAGQTDKALDALSPLAQIQGLTSLRALHAGLINQLAGQNDAAEQEYRQAVTAGPSSVRAIEVAGAFYQKAGQQDQAKAVYDRYEKDHPDSLLFDGDSLLAQGRALPQPIATPKDGMAEALFDLAALMRQGNVGDLSMIFSRLALYMQPDFQLAQMTVADLLSQQNRPAEANDIYRTISANTPVGEFSRLRVAMNLDDMGQTEAALTALDQLAKDKLTALDALVTKGDILRRKKRFAEAADTYDEAIRRAKPLEQRHWPLIFSRGVSYERSKQWAKAEADLKKSLEMQPDQPDVLNYLGYSWIDQGLHLTEARKMIERAAELRPKDGAIIDSLGWALYRMGEYQDAVKVLERAVELKAEDPTINDHLGDAYFQVGRFAEAMFQWKRAMTLDPEPEQIDPLKHKIETQTLPGQAAKP